MHKLTARPPEWKDVRALFSDLDDTMTEEGLLPASVVAALEALRARGIRVAIVTGRSAGWADCLLALLPIDAVVFENGAGVRYREGIARKTKILAAKASQKPLHTLFARLKKRIPSLRLASDQPFRLFDLAVDVCEEKPPLAAKHVETVLAAYSAQAGTTVKLSSIHVNAWRGSYTKVGGCRWLLRKWKVERTAAVYCGDSPNDEPLFAFFPESVAVANIAPYLSTLRAMPRFLLEESRAAGFVRLARLLADR